MVQVTVMGNDVSQSLKVLKKKLQREGVFRETKLRRYHETGSEKKARRKAEAVRRARKQLRKRLETEGF
ncbi:MAG: 30S ribosomal protein S21 [Alphaproteobacteria bacterium]